MRITKDLLAGVMFLAFGLGAIYVARGYDLGTLARMGSGYFPIMIGAAIALVGAVIAGGAILKPESSEAPDTVHIRPLFLVGLAIIVFGYLIESWGLIAALTALIVIASLGGKESRPLELGLMVVVLIAVAWFVFVYGLGIRINVVPR